MTIEELYGKVIADEALKESAMAAAKEGKLVEWVKEQGIETTKEELIAYAESLREPGHELSEDELDNIAGGRSYGNFITYMADCCNIED